MAAPVNANINVLVNTQQAMAQLRALQGQVATLNSSISATSGAAAAQQAALAKGLKDSANASRMWQARIVPMNTATQQFSQALDRGRMSLGQYTRFAASQLPGMSRVFKREFEMMNRVATQNVRQMQTQYVQLSKSATGAAQAMALTPTALNKHAAASAIAAQRQMMMNRMIDLGTTKLLNWGKNTQWAGRQLMVGFSIPLAMVGAVAAKAFKEIDKGSIAFKRVYGDLSTTTAEMERNLKAVKDLGQEYTKYGIKLADTIELSADVAATGAKNETLMAATEQTLRLATLGLMQYEEALQATIALQTAFGVSNEELSETIDFLNVVENETILTMQDMAAAIPRVAPVIRGLGGDVRDLAVFMTAMREGGVTAEQGANALKSGLGRLINPTKAAREVMAGFGMSIDAIIQSNKGDLMGMIQDFGAALSTLGEFEQQQVLEKVFGKYQYARLGALFKNLANDASQANRTIELTNMSMEDLASISERELAKIEEATSTKFTAAVERLKIAIAPVGEQFMKALMPVIDFITKIANKFNDLPDNIKNAIAIGVAAIAGIGPIVLMTVGLIANGIANIGKLIQTMRKFFARLRGDASLFNYLTAEEREAATAATALGGATDQLTGKFLGQRRALESLIGMVNAYTKSLAGAAAAAPLGFGMGTAAAARGATARGTVVTGPRTGGTVVYGPGGLRMAKGGVVPGTGNKDTIPAMLTPGESVVTKEATQKYGPMIQAMNAGLKIPGFINGVTSVGTPTPQTGTRVQFQSQKALVAGHLGGAMLLSVQQELARVQANIGAFSTAYVSHLRALDAAGQQHVRVYSNLVALMSQELNEDIKNGQANISRVKAEIGNPAAQVELKRQLKLLGMQDDEIAQVLNRYVTNLNAQLDAAQARLGTAGAGNLPAKQMDRLLQRAAVGAANRTFTDPAQRAMFARLATQPTTFLPGEGKGRRTMQSGSASRANPEARSYTSLRKSYGISAATKFPTAGIAAAGYTPQAMQQVFAGMPAAAQQAVIATKGNLEKALPIFREYGLKAGVSYNEGMVGAISTGKPNVSQAVSKNRQAASPAPWAAPMGVQDGGAYGKGFTSAAATEAAKIKQSILGMSGGKPGGLPPAQQALAQGTRVRPQGFPASVYNPANNPAGLGLTGEARAARGFAGAIESRTAVYRRAQAQEEAMLAEQNKFKVVDRRLSGVKQQAAAVLGEEITWLEKQSMATQKLAQQRALNEAALKAEQEAQARLNGAKQRAAVMQETMNQRPARGGILDRPLGAIRRFAFPGGQDAALKNLGFNQFTGQVKTAGQLIVESAKGIKIRVAGAISNISTDFKLATQKLLVDAKNAGTLLKSDFKNLGGTIKTNMQVDLNTIKTAATNTATAIRNLGTSAASAAQRMAGGIGGFLNSVDKNGTSRLQKMGQAGNGAVMGLMGLSMAASFAGGSVGEMAQKIMPVTMGLMGLQMILPMFTNPMGLAIIAITALVGTFIWMRKSVDDAAKSAARLAAEQGAAANRMETIAEALDYEFAADRISNRQFRFTLDEETQSAFQNYFEGEAGSKFIADLKAATSEERFAKLSSQLAFAIADGLDPQRARDFGLAVAKELDDSLLASLLQGAFVRGEFKAGSQAMIDLIAERQQAAMGLEISPADYRSQMSLSQRMTQTLIDPVGETVYGLTRPIADLAGTANTTTDVLGRAAIEIGAFTAAGAGLGAAAGIVGGPLAGLTAAGGALGGFFAGLSKVAFTLPKELDRLEENSRSVAAAFSASIQVLRELDNAEALLLEERRQGLITAEEYARKEAELNRIKNTQAEILGSAITELVEQGANEQAIVDQLVMGGFDEATAGAVARATNRDIVSAQLFEGKDYEGLTEQQRNFVNTAIADIFSGLTPENAQQKINDIQSVYSQIAANLDEATLGTMDLAGLQSLGESERIAQAAQTVFSDMLGMDLIPTFGEDVAKNFEYLQPILQDLGMSSTELFNELIKFKDPQLARDIALNRAELARLANNLSELSEFESIDIELVTSKKINAKELADALERMGTVRVNDKVAGILLNPEVYSNIGVELGKTVPEIESSYTKLADKLDDAFITAKKNTKDLNGEIKGVQDQLLLTESGEFVINQKLVMDIFGADVESASEISSILNGAFPDGLDPIMLQIAIQAVMDPVTRALIAANPDAFKAAMAGESTYQVSNLGVEERRYGVPERNITKNVADADPFFAALAANAKLIQEFERGQQTFDKPDKDLDKSRSGGGSKEQTALEKLQESIDKRTKLYLGVTRAGKKLDAAKKGYFGRLLAETTTNNSIANQLRKMNLSETLIADILAEGAESAQEIINALGPNGLKRKSKEDILGRAGELVDQKRGEATRGEYKATAKRKLEETGEFSAEEIEEILQDENATEIIALLPKKAQKVWKQLIRSLRQAADATEEVETASERSLRQFDEQSDKFGKLVNMMEQGFDAAELEAADAVAAKFFEDNTGLAEKLAESTGHTVENGYQLAEAMERQVLLNDRLIDQEQERIDGKQEEIDDYTRINDLIKQGIDDIKRQEELRNRRSESLSKDLEDIAKTEEDIRESYQKRIDALDKVAEINDYIIEQQKKQIDLSRSISEGDIYAATQAAQDMRAASAQQAVEQRRSALEQGMENAIEGLTNAEGMTRADIEEEINNIKEQNYQTSLLIREEEDRIYQNNLEIRRLTNEIYDIQENIIEPLQNQNNEYSKMLEYYKEDADYQVSRVTLAGMTREQFEKQADALKNSIDNAKDLDPELKRLVGDYNAIEAAARAAADQAARLGTDIATEEYNNRPDAGTTSSAYTPPDYSNMDPGLFAGIDFSNMDLSGLGTIYLGMGGKVRKYAAGGLASPLKYTSNEPPPAQKRSDGGEIFGNGSRDSVPAMLTPGEFVVRKAMVGKYGMPLMKALNQGSFTMPRYNMGEGVEAPEVKQVNNAISNISAPVYNTYDMKFSINGANQSADEIANKVMFKMKQLQSQGVRSNRGY